MVTDVVPSKNLGEAMGPIRTATDAAVITAPLIIGFTLGVPALGYLGGIGIVGAIYALALAAFAMSSRGSQSNYRFR